MSLPGPFLAGQILTAGELNDATQKTITSVDVNTSSPLVTGVTNVETTITQFTLGPIDQVAGALYRINMRTYIQQSSHFDEFLMFMRKDTPLTGTIVASWDMFKLPVDNAGFWFLGWADIPATIDESGVTYYFSVDSFSSTPLGNLIVWGHNPSIPTVTPSGLVFSRVGYASEYTVVT